MNKLSDLVALTTALPVEPPINKEVFRSAGATTSNEFLLILKPEIFAKTTQEQQKVSIEKIESALNQYNFSIGSIRIFNAAYLRQYKIMDQHYGMINAAARNIQENITQEARSNFSEMYNLSFDEAPVWGALQAIEKGVLDENELNELWKDCKIDRLAGGQYCSKLQLKGETIYIVNGFHPPQLHHFISPGRIIVTLNVNSNVDWKIARQKMTGNTYPEKASPESIRGALFQQFGKFGFDEVSYVLNSIHLSAGPLEGLIELLRFNTDFENKKAPNIKEFAFGELLLETFKDEQVAFILTNPTVQFEGKSTNLFDLTEEVNSSKAIELLKQVIQ